MTLGDIYPAILALVLIGIVLGIGLFIMGEIREQVGESTAFQNQTLVNGTASDWTNTTTLANAGLDDYELLSVVSVVNATGAGAITNYTWTSAGIITWGNDVADASTGALGATVNITTTQVYDRADSPQESINDTLEGISTFANWIAILVVVIAAAVVLGVVLSSFGGRPRV